MNDKVKTEKIKISHRFGDFMNRNRIVMYTILGLVVLSIIGFFVANTIMQKRNDKAAVAFEGLNKIYSEWQSASDADKALKEDTLNKEIALIQKNYASSFGAKKSILMEAEIFAGKNDFIKAGEKYSLAADKYTGSLISASSRLNAAVSYEKAVKSDLALIQLQKFAADKKSSQSTYAPRVYFWLGMIYENNSDVKKALDSYYFITDNFADSEFAKLAKDRIILLKINNKDLAVKTDEKKKK